MRLSAFLLGIVFVVACSPEKNALTTSSRIHVNQVGFYPGQEKVAVVSEAGSAQKFSIINLSNDSAVVFEGELSAERKLQFSEATKIATFTSVNSPGTYCVVVPGVGYSFPFEIKEKVYDKVARASIKAFYFQRLSTALTEPYAGKWNRKFSHADNEVIIHPSAADAQRKSGSIIATPKGWLDAGDYNKYIVNSGITIGTLLSAYEDFPAYYDTLSLNIPESNNSTPDILDEIVWNLRWMLTMQDPHDGGVYHKCTNASFDPFVMPEQATTPRYVVQKGTGATLDFAAVTAQAARILKQFPKDYPALADSCLRASLKAFSWAKQNPNVIYDQKKLNDAFDPDISTGGYGDQSFVDEFSWAASELLITTQDKQFSAEIARRRPEKVTVPSWPQVHVLGDYTLLRHSDLSRRLYGDSIDVIKSQLLALADSLVANINTHPFNTVFGDHEKSFIWGSNAVAANQSVVLLNAFKISGKKKYLIGALHNLDYILGRNATHYSFVTGFGALSPLHPHHRPSEADAVDEPVPGFLVGGPNASRQDKCEYPFTSPDKSYVDHVCSYASNEVAINWNAPLVYLAGAAENYQSDINDK